MNRFSSYLDSHFGEDFTLEEGGVQIVPETRTKIRRRLQELVLRSPSNSYVNLKLFRKNDGIRGELNMSSSDGLYSVVGFGKDPLNTYLELERNLDLKLLQWRENRFRSEKKEASALLTGGVAA